MSAWKFIAAMFVFLWLAFLTWAHTNLPDPISPGMPSDDSGPSSKAGKASWYGEGYRGKKMANGEPFDPDALTCATWEWPLGTWLFVEHKGVGVCVLVTDRGPDRRLNRIVDLSREAFTRIADLRLGVVKVSVTPCVPVAKKGMVGA